MEGLGVVVVDEVSSTSVFLSGLVADGESPTDCLGLDIPILALVVPLVHFADEAVVHVLPPCGQ